MRKRIVDLPTSAIRTVCKILDIFDGPLDYPQQSDTALIILTPLGTDLVFPVACETYSEPMNLAKGKFVYAELSASWSVMKRTDQRQCSFTDGAGAEPSADTDRSFRAIGQYVGDTGVDILLQSKFLLLIGHDGDVQPQIGDWIEAHGELTIHWSAEDIIEVMMQA